MNYYEYIHQLKAGSNYERDKIRIHRQIGIQENIDATETNVDVWDLKQDRYELSESGELMQITSTNNLDTNYILVTCINEYGFYDDTLVVQLQGHTPVVFPRNIQYIYNITNISGVNLQGQVYITPSGAATTNGLPNNILLTASTIQSGNKSFSSFFRCPPAAERAFISQIIVTLTKTSGSTTRGLTASLMVRSKNPFGNYSTYQDFIYFAPTQHGQPQITVDPNPEAVLVPNDELKIQVKGVTDNATAVQSAFSVIIFNKKTAKGL